MRGTWSGARSVVEQRLGDRRTSGAKSRRQRASSAPSVGIAASRRALEQRRGSVVERMRERDAAARSTRRPCSASGSVRKNGDATPSGWIAEQTSCTKPGSVSSAERAPPPTVSAASSTRTESPARASLDRRGQPVRPRADDYGIRHRGSLVTRRRPL